MHVHWSLIAAGVIAAALLTTSMSPRATAVGHAQPDPSVGSCTRPPNGLTGWWPGDGDRDDIVGGRDALLRGGTTFTPGLVDKAFALDGDGDFAEVPDEDALDVGTGDFTVDLWVKFNDTSGEQVLVEKYIERFDLAETSGWTLTKLDGNVILLALGSAGGVDSVRSRSPRTRGSTSQRGERVAN